MAKKYWTAERLNQEMKKIEQAGYQMPTRMYRIQEGRTAIIVDNSLVNAGQIRTYEEAYNYMARVRGDKFRGYTLEQYKAALRELQDELGRERSYAGEVREQRSQLLNILKDAVTDNMGNTDNYLMNKYKHLNTQELYNAVKQANQMVKDSNAKSPMFYEYLVDILDGLVDAKYNGV